MLHDLHELEDRARGRIEHRLPRRLPEWLYLLALERGFVDALLVAGRAERRKCASSGRARFDFAVNPAIRSRNEGCTIMQAMALTGEVREPLPVRRRLTVLRDGSTHASDLVFCEPSGHSVALVRCATCGFGGGIGRDADGRPATVECGRSTLPSLGSTTGEPLKGTGAARVAALLPVGLSLVQPVICVSHDTPLRVASRVLVLEPCTGGIAVVDGQRRFLGTLPQAKLSLALAHPDEKAATHVTDGKRCVDEHDSFGAAFGTMAATHARELIVLGEDRTFAGVLRDVDALRFVAHVSRTGLRPALRIRCA